MSARSRRAAQCSAVVPSASASLTGARCRSRLVTADALPLLAASIRRVSVAAPSATATQRTTSTVPTPTLDLIAPPGLERDSPLVATELLELDAIGLGHADQEISVWCERVGDDMPIAFDGTCTAADEQRRKQIRRVHVSVAHAAAVEQ